MRRSAERVWDRVLAGVGVTLIAVGALRAATAVHDRLGEHDFAHYYASTRSLLEGSDPYRSLPYQQWGLAPEPGLTDRAPGGTNPPPLLHLLAPFVLLPSDLAQWAWNGCQALSLGAALFVAWFAVRDRTRLPPYLCVAGLVVVSDSVYWHFYFGQVQLLLAALLFSAAWLSLRERHAGALALATTAGLLKLYPFALLPWFAWRASRRRPWTLVVPALLIGAALATMWDQWGAFLADGMTSVRRQAVNQTANFSAPALILNVGWWWTRSLDPGPFWWGVAAATSISILVAAYARRRLPPERRFALLLCAMVAASLTAWPHYFVFLALPFALAASDLLRSPSRAGLLGLAGCWLFGLQVANGSGVAGSLLARLLLNHLPLAGLAGLAVWMARAPRDPRPAGS